MKKILYCLSSLVALLLLTGLVSCTMIEDEKELKIIEGDLPIKTSALYMVGDATPNGWDIGKPTPLEATAEDALVFTWEGSLYEGEMKLCLTPGSWDVSFIRPEVGGTEISKTAITDQKFVMYAGDPDNKWKVTDEGKYRLTFNLRNWTMSTEYLGENEPPVVEPIATEMLYIVGDATPNGWSIDVPTLVEKKSQYVFVYEGALTAGEFKACMETGDWSVPFIRPKSADCRIDKNGVESPDFVLAAAPDNKWKVAEAGNYKLTFDLEHWTITAEYLGPIVVVKDPIEADAVYIVGDATPAGWTIEAPTQLVKKSQYVFVYKGILINGEFKACTETGDWNVKFIRPESSDVEISSNGVTSTDFVYSVGPDDKWTVKDAGNYRITFDLEHWTITVEYLGPIENKAPIETETLYMIGDATPNGWSMDDPTPFTRDATNKYIFTWQGNLTVGSMKACLKPDGTFSCPFLRPSEPDVEISASGVAQPDFVYTTNPDDKWLIKEAGTYKITFDLEKYTIQVEKK